MANLTGKRTAARPGGASRGKNRSRSIIEGVGTRIAEVALGLGGVPNLAKAINISESQLYRQISGESEVKVGSLVAIARAGDTTVEWLATGNGPRRPGDALNGERCLRVPLYDVRFNEGARLVAQCAPSVHAIFVPRAWPREHAGASSDNLAFVYMPGNAMMPTLRNGDLLLVDLDDTLVTEGIYLGIIDGWPFVHRLKRITGKSICVMKEGEPNRPTGELPSLRGFQEPSRIVGRVIWAGHCL